MVRPRPVPVAALAVLVLLLSVFVRVQPADALQPIDDFDSGAFGFNAANGPAEHIVSIPAHGSHAIHWERKIVLNPVNGTVFAGTVGGPSSIDDAVQVWPTGDGSCEIQWYWGWPADLTWGGTVDRVELEILAAQTGTEVRLALTDDIFSTAQVRNAAGGPETMTWDLTGWGGVDPRSATGMRLVFSSATAPYTVSDFRFRRSGSEPVDLVERFVATQIPPLPSPPLGWDVWASSFGEIYSLDLVISAADAGFLPEMSAEWQSWPAMGGWNGAAEFSWDTVSSFVDTDLELTVNLASTSGFFPEAYPPDEVSEARGFLLEFPVRIGDGGGTYLGTSTARLQFDIGEGQAAEFQNVVVTGPSGPGRAWGSSFTVAFRVADVGGVDGSLPLFNATWIADWNPTMATGLPETVRPAGAAEGAGLRLTAVPSVTATGTEIRASRPFGAAATVMLFDVTGRHLRSLTAPAGASSVRWDGRTGNGWPAPAGVYFVRLEDASSVATTRVLRVR